MVEQFIGKKCDILVSFGTSGVDKGASPIYYYGTIRAVDNDFVSVDVESASTYPNLCKGKDRNRVSFEGNSKTIISRNYIISIREVIE